MPKRPTEEELDAAYREVDRETDRYAAIIAGSIFEDALESVMQDCFVPLSNTKYKVLFESYGPLSTFAVKIDLAYALGLIGIETRFRRASGKECSKQVRPCSEVAGDRNFCPRPALRPPEKLP
jgi:hypothetical protein